MTDLFSRYMQQLTGAKNIIFILGLPNIGDSGHKIISVNPKRPEKLIEAERPERLGELSCGIKGAALMNAKPDSATGNKPLSDTGHWLFILAPLVTEKLKTGGLLLLDFPDEHNAMEAMKVINF